MRVVVIVLACLFHKGSAIPEAYDQSLDTLGTLLLAKETLHAPRSSVRERPGAAREALRMRGGSDIVGPKKVAKFMTALGTLSGLQAAFAPQSTYDTYGIAVPQDERDNELLGFLVESNGLASLASTILSWSMMKDGEPMKAIGYGYLPWVLSGMNNVRVKRATKVGMPEWTTKFFVALNGFFAWSFITGQDYCPTLKKVASGWTLFNGVFSALRPKKFGKNWGLENMDNSAEALMKYFGYNLIGFGVLSKSVGEDTELTKALGYFWATFLAGQVDSMFISKTFDKCGMKKEPLYAWMLLQAGATAALLGQGE